MADAGSQAGGSASAGTSTGGAPEVKKSSFLYPLIKSSDMPEEVRIESVETVVTAIEKFPTNYESAAKLIKETLDKKFGASWHCIIGEGFGFEITYESKNLLYMFFGGTMSILVFKSS